MRRPDPVTPVEADLVPACQHTRAGILPSFALTSGLPTGKYRRGAGAGDPAGTRLESRPDRLAPAGFDRIEALESYARQRAISTLDVAVGGPAAQPAVASVIAGATSAEQMRQNVAARLWGPSAEDLAAPDDVVPGPAAG